ncbi:NADH:flavin oxidoreductase [Sphingobium sp.]|uniref:NADH:flavin oxidoreductase n=1 Tax=Sphingobium sp. TaxID=1912891 RepID=UPI00257FB0D4|nr:NADH:flavin oxidoreductase [Sphingobium sp.]
MFTPFSFGRHQLPNRIVMAPMTRQQSPGGIPSDAMGAYYRRRAEGGVGLVITEGTYIDHPAANGYKDVPAFFGQAALSAWADIAEMVHAAGALIVPQLWHVGAIRRPGLEPDPMWPGVGPSAVKVDGEEVVRAMDHADIKDVIASYARAAANAELHGFDGVEIHGAHEYLIDQFLWSKTNHRQDAYGGSIENRVRLAVEIINAIRSAVSADFPILFRFSQWKIQDYDARIAENSDELAALLRPIANAGVDIFHVSTRRFNMPAFEGSPDGLAVWTRKLTGKPVIAVGSVALKKAYAIAQLRGGEDPTAEPADLSAIEQQVADGRIDLVALGRPLLADPQWPKKVFENRLSEINPFDKDAIHTTL